MTRNAQSEALRRSAHSAAPQNQPFAVLALAVLGVVYGDIGTSPIYALRQCFAGVDPVPVTAANVLGVLSLIFWTLILVISLKYMTFVLRADNRGEGGIFALLALLRPDRGRERWPRRMLAAARHRRCGHALRRHHDHAGHLGAERGGRPASGRTGSCTASSSPITVVILFLLFAVQRHGTAKLGAVFGPLMLLWFLVLAALGIRGIVAAPQVLLAVNPWYAVQFFAGQRFRRIPDPVCRVPGHHRRRGAVCGPRPFRPQPHPQGVVRLRAAGAAHQLFRPGRAADRRTADTIHPFFDLAPSWALYPLVILATAATCIASQAVITGAYSLTRQAIQLGQLPHLKVDADLGGSRAARSTCRR